MLIRKEICDLCGCCVAVCPVDAVTLDEFTAVIDKDVCTECGNCIAVCPAAAIVK